MATTWCLCSFTLFIIVYLINNLKADTEGKCAKFGEYCQNHWDCCSNSCLSYKWRCTRGYQHYPYPIISTRFQYEEPNYISYNELLELVFGKHVQENTEEPTISFTSRFGLVRQVQDTTEKVVSSNEDRGQCKATGEKCYSSEECCTKICHGFLHQCVT